MKETPILFTPDHVKKIFANVKTQTRRTVKLGNPFYSGNEQGVQYIHDADAWRFWASRNGGIEKAIPGGTLTVREFSATISHDLCCPFGQVGDRLWVKERWRTYERQTDMVDGILFEDGSFQIIENSKPAADAWVEAHQNGRHGDKFRNPMFMPRWASRLTLEIVKIRVERLQAISEVDCIEEGVVLIGRTAPRIAYMTLWDSINIKRYPWKSNPWVWVLEFKRA